MSRWGMRGGKARRGQGVKDETNQDKRDRKLAVSIQVRTPEPTRSQPEWKPLSYQVKERERWPIFLSPLQDSSPRTHSSYPNTSTYLFLPQIVHDCSRVTCGRGRSGGAFEEEEGSGRGGLGLARGSEVMTACFVWVCEEERMDEASTGVRVRGDEAADVCL